MTWQGETFKGKLGINLTESKADWRMPPRPAEGSPNVIMIVLDDVGYGHLGCYGAPISTPNIDRLADNGLRYNNFHTTALCSHTLLPADWPKSSHQWPGHDLGTLPGLSRI